MLLGGRPFEEPMLMWWNYVAHTRAEIVAADSQWTSRDPRFRLRSTTLKPVDPAPPPWSEMNWP